MKKYSKTELTKSPINIQRESVLINQADTLGDILNRLVWIPGMYIEIYFSKNSSILINPQSHKIGIITHIMRYFNYDENLDRDHIDLVGTDGELVDLRKLDGKEYIWPCIQNRLYFLLLSFDTIVKNS